MHYYIQQYSYSLDGVFGGLGGAGLGLVEYTSLGGVAENSTEAREASSSIVSSFAGEDVLLLTGTATGTLAIEPSLLNSDDSSPYKQTNIYMMV